MMRKKKTRSYHPRSAASHRARDWRVYLTNDNVVGLRLSEKLGAIHSADQWGLSPGLATDIGVALIEWAAKQRSLTRRFPLKRRKS